MSESNMGWRAWAEQFVPCRLHNKNIVLTCLAILCFALVTWTVLATVDGPEKPPASNQTYVMVDDTKDFDSLNFTMSSVLSKAKAKPTKATPRPKDIRSVFRPIVSVDDGREICKCICDLNATDTDVLLAIKAVIEAKKMKVNGTTLKAPKVIGENDDGDDDDDDGFD